MKTLVLLEKPIAFVQTKTFNLEVYDIEDFLKLVGSFLWSEPAAREEREFEIRKKREKYIYTVIGVDRYIYPNRKEKDLRRYIPIIKKAIEKIRQIDQDLNRLVDLTSLWEVFFEGNYFPALFKNISIVDERLGVGITIYTESLLLDKFLAYENLSFTYTPAALMRIAQIWENYKKIKEDRLQNFLARKTTEEETSIEDMLLNKLQYVLNPFT